VINIHAGCQFGLKVLEIKQSFHRAQNTASTRPWKFYNSADTPCFLLEQHNRANKNSHFVKKMLQVKYPKKQFKNVRRAIKQKYLNLKQQQFR
jgi:hypothetical protein